MIRHWDAPCLLTCINAVEDAAIGITHVRVEIKLLSPYGDGSGKKDQTIQINPNQLNADGGWEEISSALQSLLNKTNFPRKESIMSAIENSYDKKSLKELTEMYNSMVDPKKRVKRFKDKPTAIKRMTEAFKNPVAATTASKQESQPKVPAKLAKAATVVAQQFKIVGRKSAHAGKKIYKLVKENPRREGSHGFKNWEIYRDGMTYEEFIMAKGGANHLNYDLEHEFVELR